MKTLAIASATLALAFTAGTAVAQPTAPESKTVEFADLNLSSPQGQARLDRRIESAARDVCSGHLRVGASRIRPSSYRECLASARASTKQQVAVAMEEFQRGG